VIWEFMLVHGAMASITITAVMDLTSLMVCG
jgi:hypothetical protein